MVANLISATKNIFLATNIFVDKRHFSCSDIPVLDDIDFKKDYALDDVATKLLDFKCVWPKSNALKVSDLTLKYNDLHKIALSNRLPIKHVTTVSKDFATVLYDISTGAPVHLGQLFFNLIVSHRCGQNKNQKLPFSDFFPP